MQSAAAEAHNVADLFVSENELKQVQELFSQAADNCLNLKKPD